MHFKVTDICSTVKNMKVAVNLRLLTHDFSMLKIIDVGVHDNDMIDCRQNEDGENLSPQEAYDIQVNDFLEEVKDKLATDVDQKELRSYIESSPDIPSFCFRDGKLSEEFWKYRENANSLLSDHDNHNAEHVVYEIYCKYKEELVSIDRFKQDYVGVYKYFESFMEQFVKGIFKWSPEINDSSWFNFIDFEEVHKRVNKEYDFFLNHGEYFVFIKR